MTFDDIRPMSSWTKHSECFSELAWSKISEQNLNSSLPHSTRKRSFLFIILRITLTVCYLYRINKPPLTSPYRTKSPPHALYPAYLYLRASIMGALYLRKSLSSCSKAVQLQSYSWATYTFTICLFYNSWPLVDLSIVISSTDSRGCQRLSGFAPCLRMNRWMGAQPERSRSSPILAPHVQELGFRERYPPDT